MSVRACLRRAAVGVNLFRVYRTEPSLFTRTYIALSYLYVAGFGTASIMLVTRLLQSSQLVYQCETSPTLERMCPAQLTLCSCPDSAALRMHVCDGADRGSLAGCACCWYGHMPTETILLLLSTQIGGLYTFMMGVCLVILAVVRVVGSGDDAADAAPPRLTLNPVGRPPGDDDDDDDPEDGMRASLVADLETLEAAGRGRSRIVDL